MPFVTAADGAQIFYKDWGTGRPVVLSHGWPLNSDSWEAQQLFLAAHGYRVVAHDRRGHGRSTQTWDGNEMDTYAADLAALVEALDLRDATLVGFSTGGGEVTRYIGRYGTGRVAQLVLVSAVPPLMVRREDNPGGVPIEVFDGIRAGSLADRSQTYKDLADGPFFGHDRPGAQVSQGIRDAFWLQACSPGTATPWSASGRSPRPTSAATSRRSTSPRSSSTATTTRSCPSRWAARPRRAWSRAPS
jgi:non-heme chloroperoxidase